MEEKFKLPKRVAKDQTFTLRKCKICHIDYPPEGFYSRTHRGGSVLYYSHMCKICRRAKEVKANRKENKENRKEISARYYRNNKETIIKRQASYKKGNRERAMELQRIRRANDKEGAIKPVGDIKDVNVPVGLKLLEQSMRKLK